MVSQRRTCTALLRAWSIVYRIDSQKLFFAALLLPGPAFGAAAVRLLLGSCTRLRSSVGRCAMYGCKWKGGRHTL